MNPPRPKIMGILNVTPDSFSDGGRFHAFDSAVSHGLKLVQEGADLLDVGGESTRPGANAVSTEEELERVIPVIEALSTRTPVPLSIDTSKPEVARAAVEAGATWINDVTGGIAPEMASIGVDFPKTHFILMHMLGTPRTMQKDPSYSFGVEIEVFDYLSARIEKFEEVGVGRHRIYGDPGIGFGKNLQHNLLLLKYVKRFAVLGAGVVVGTSRKSFLSRILGVDNLPIEEREAGTLASNLWAAKEGAAILRVHDVGSMKRALDTWMAIEGVTH